MEKCWQENPDIRPNFENIRKDLLSLIEKQAIIEICVENANLTQILFSFLTSLFINDKDIQVEKFSDDCRE